MREVGKALVAPIECLYAMKDWSGDEWFGLFIGALIVGLLVFIVLLMAGVF